ncbi:hypothetical protein F4679DRAFT_598710 [Xylaria curta]|nr:hypothetical protein F4679DRAFT_598710 [Xylaria curta]
MCGDGDCREPEEMFPDLQVIPRAEPDPSMKDDHDAWLLEYEQWRELTCPCGRGYFCREHGRWISKDDVISEKALTKDEQKKDGCPSYHYEELR